MTNNAGDVVAAIVWQKLDGTSGGVPSAIAPNYDKTGQRPALSGDGRWLAFTTTNQLAVEDHNTDLDVYLQDLNSTGGPIWISHSAAGENLEGDCAWPVISPDGAWVVFRRNSLAANRRELWLRDLTRGTSTLLALEEPNNRGVMSGFTPIPAPSSAVVFAAGFLPLADGGDENLNLFALTTEPTPPDGDSDHDGLPDDWEMSNFGNLDRDGGGDWDGDGATDRQEWQAKTDPKNPASKMALATVKSAGSSGLILIWTTPAGQMWVLESSPTLSPPAWQPVTSGVTTGPGLGESRFEPAGIDGSSFFRLVVKP